MCCGSAVNEKKNGCKEVDEHVVIPVGEDILPLSVMIRS